MSPVGRCLRDRRVPRRPLLCIRFSFDDEGLVQRRIGSASGEEGHASAGRGLAAGAQHLPSDALRHLQIERDLVLSRRRGQAKRSREGRAAAAGRAAQGVPARRSGEEPAGLAAPHRALGHGTRSGMAQRGLALDVVPDESGQERDVHRCRSRGSGQSDRNRDARDRRLPPARRVASRRRADRKADREPDADEQRDGDQPAHAHPAIHLAIALSRRRRHRFVRRQ
jgi:hypothetical protein